MKNYKISEVAKMFNITRTSLIHYDNWSILSPSIRNEKNYRYYTQEDIKKLELILALKESGLSLDDIKSYLHEESNQTSIELLTNQNKEIQKKVKFLKEQSLIIKKRIEYLKKFETVDIYEGILVNEEPELTVTFETIGYGPLMNYSSAVNKLKNRLNKEAQITSKFGICYDVSQADNYIQKYVFDYLSSSKDKTHHKVIPKQKYLRMIHKGNHSLIDQSIAQLIEYANEKNYIIQGEAFYVPLFDYWESVSDEFIGEILLPVLS